MTSTNVTQAAGIFLNANAANSNVPNIQENAGEDSFSQVMSRAVVKADVPVPRVGEASANLQKVSELGNTGKRTQANPGGTDGTSVADGKQNGNTEEASAKVSEKNSEEEIQTEGNRTEESQGEETIVKEPAEVQEEEIPEEIIEIVAESIVEIKQTIMEMFDISEEELQEVMETTEISDIGLLEPDNMKQLVLAISGEEESLNLLMDEELYGKVQELTEAVETAAEGLQEELQVQDGEFEGLLQKLEVSAKPEESIQQEIPVREEAAEEVVEEVTVVTDRTKKDVEVTKTTESTEREIPEETVETAVKREVPVEEERGQKSSGNREHEQQSQHSFLQNFTHSNVAVSHETVMHVPMEAPIPEVPDTYRVMEQVTEFMRTQVQLENTNEVQMQLQPETLGTIHIHLAAKEGAVTAQFTAQNEEVKAVLEAQIVQLKENLNEQGIKVEAVEVTVASHGFDRNLHQEDGESGQQEAPKKKGTRRIQLDGSMSIEDMDLSEEDRIAAEMMEANGNTVDYTA